MQHTAGAAMSLQHQSVHHRPRTTNCCPQTYPHLTSWQLPTMPRHPTLTTPRTLPCLTASSPSPVWQHSAARITRRQCVCRAVNPGAGPEAYAQMGPLTPRELDPVTVVVGGDAELPITAQIQVTVPSGGPTPAPLVLLSAGFLLNASLYASYASHLASWGYAVAVYDVSEVMDDRDTTKALRRILDTCTGGAKLSPYCSGDQGVVLVGHSRGGKLSCLAAAEDSRVRGLCLLDPVDNTDMTPPGEGYPSALPALLRCTAPPRSVPLLLVGAGAGGDVIPESANFRLFSRASRGPMWYCELKGAGHLGFLDKQVGLFSLFSAPGTTPDAAVREASKVAILTWLRHAVQPGAGALPCEQAVDQARVAIARIVRNEVISTCYRLDALNSQPSATSSSQARSPPPPPPPPPPRAQKPLEETYESLMSRRARDLKAMLVERNIPCSDCFEKEQLAKRLIESCGVVAR